jgi:C-terminal processing protease CtpA/Prc
MCCAFPVSVCYYTHLMLFLNLFHMQTFFIEDPTLAATKTEAEGLRDRLMIAFSRLNTIASEANATVKAAADGKAASAKVTSGTTSGASPTDGAAVGEEKKMENPDAEQELEFTVPIGELGIGLVIVHDSNSSHVVIKGFRAMPYKKENPAQAAGLRVNDRIKSINGRTLSDHNHAVNLIRSAQGEIKLVVSRRGA